MILRCNFCIPEKPTIAAVHGYCLAGAFEVMLACDISIAEEKTFLGESEVRLDQNNCDVSAMGNWAQAGKRDTLRAMID